MDVYQLMDLSISLSNRLDTHWTLFITVHLALIGGIIYVDRPLKRSEKIAAILVYSGFAAINYAMMHNQIAFMNSINVDIAAYAAQECCRELNSIAHVVRMNEFGSFKTAIWSIVSIHLAMYILVIVSILNDKAAGADKPSDEIVKTDPVQQPNQSN